MRRETVEDVMTRQVEFVSPLTTVAEAAEKMSLHGVGSLPVCEDQRVVGIVTDRDITVRSTAKGRDPREALVGQIMSRHVVSCMAEQPLEEAEQLMHDHQVRRLPVVDTNLELIGYLAMAKVARVEDERQAGRVIKGVSQPSPPDALTPRESVA